MSKLAVAIIALSSPLILWVAVVVAARRSLFTLRSMYRVLKVWHVLVVIIGAVLVLGFFEQPPARYGWGALIFSFGMIWPEQWLKKRIGPLPASFRRLRIVVPLTFLPDSGFGDAPTRLLPVRRSLARNELGIDFPAFIRLDHQLHFMSRNSTP